MLFFNFHTLSDSLTLKSIMMPYIIQKGWKYAIFWCIIRQDILNISRDMNVLVQLAKLTCSPPLSNPKYKMVFPTQKGMHCY